MFIQFIFSTYFLYIILYCCIPPYWTVLLFSLHHHFILLHIVRLNNFTAFFALFSLLHYFHIYVYIYTHTHIHETTSFLCLNIYKNLEMMSYVVWYYHIYYHQNEVDFLLFLFFKKIINNCFKKN